MEAWARQNGLVTERIAGEISDTLVLNEHDPVYTIGLRSGSDQHLVWDAPHLAREGIEVVKTNRGGDITYHGPGQLVGYPIVDLSPRKDLHVYLRFLENVLIHTVSELGFTAARRDGKTGIWIENRKVAAIGVAVRRWVTYHGFALNVNANLLHFQGIVPCGITATDGTVTSLHAEHGHPIDIDVVKAIVATQFQRRFPAFLAGEEIA